MEVHAIFSDFGGVLTDNKVFVDQFGRESVVCDRADGLAFDVLRKLNIPVTILSTEANPVVSVRAKKLKIACVQGISDKAETLLEFVKRNKYDFENILYVGNDVNDLLAMKLCGYRVCPADSHPEILSLANFPLETRGGSGVFREIVEKVMKQSVSQILYAERQIQ